ncbi:hypothetical protein QJS10_CPA06g00478 [Acorus calamus]|uniref:Uncharacterized protein n=1 Tax=Acorus calamus TaxID=4465 RepID=A0AAV9E1K2_ACOCL|nr:hypothetical protein QJS10_CPA10g01061 [Acorus calamus]KAK1313956.1 hypothetical protein QJS10_CPA06g00478 [Acorus calamus]
MEICKTPWYWSCWRNHSIMEVGLEYTVLFGQPTSHVFGGKYSTKSSLVDYGHICKPGLCSEILSLARNN